jgi:glycerate 2-kinase
MDACGVDKALQDADWVITGEGRFDSQSLQGKVVSGIVNAARRNHVKVAVIAGQIALGESEWRRGGVEQALGLVPVGPVTPEMLKEAGTRLADAVRTLANEIG